MDIATTWGVFARLLALVYVVAFLIIRREILPLHGSRGVTPIAEKMARMRADLGARWSLLRHPSLLWLNASDAALAWLPWAGVACGIAAACGIASPVMLAAAWLIYLSFDVAIGLSFPWESMLLEAGFLAILLPALEPLPALRMSGAPEPILAFAFHWLLFRVLFGFGKTKFTREAVHEPDYLRGFLISQPIPSPLGWRAARLPRPLLVWSHALLFIAEMLLPFAVFVPGWPRLAAAGVFTALMISIQVMGNFGFFNILVVVLCVPLFDPRAVTAQTLTPLASPYGGLLTLVVAWSVLAGLCHLPFNTWVARGWTEWPVWGAFRGVPGAILAVLRGMMPFRTVHAYGVFPPRIGPPVKFLPVIEGTLDGERWETFEYRYMPSTDTSPPRFVAPHCPRLDHFVLYEGVAVGSGNYLGTIFSVGNPYDFSTVSTMDRLLQRLMERDSPVRTLFKTVPFGGEPPLRMRARMFAFWPTTPRALRETGRYWSRDLVGLHARERHVDPALFDRWLPDPVQFHPDERWARRRVARLGPLLQARSLEDVRGVLPARGSAAWDLFWNDVIPDVRHAAATPEWLAIEEVAGRLRATHGAAGVDALDLVRGAVTTALLERMEPHVLVTKAPRLTVPSYFHASLAAHAIVLRGRAATEQALGSDQALLAAVDADSEARGLKLIGALRFEMLAMHARKQRLLAHMLPDQPPPPAGVPGFTLVMPRLADALPEPEERLPLLR